MIIILHLHSIDTPPPLIFSDKKNTLYTTSKTYIDEISKMTHFVRQFLKQEDF